MHIIQCTLDTFMVESYDTEDLLECARSITSYLKDELKKIKLKLNVAIKQSAAFIALEENLSEYVHNSIDAFRKHNKLNNKYIILEIPENPSPDKTTCLIYRDTAGGFSEDFLNGKQQIDYYHDKLQEHKLQIPSEKLSLPTHYLGGAGLALSQTSRFLHRHNGTLTLENTDTGAQMRLISPIGAASEHKPSFYRFVAHVDSKNLWLCTDKSINTATGASIVSDEPISPIPSTSIEKITQKKHQGLKLKI